MKDCLFCKIIRKEIDCDIVYETDNVLVFKDVNPKAPIHFLMVPKKHISSIMEIEKLDCNIVKEMMEIVAKVAKSFELDKDGFRLVTNMGSNAGQSVEHLHFHIMGKRKFNWPPG
jgi:histidine triad (HIT) family protein